MRKLFSIWAVLISVLLFVAGTISAEEFRVLVFTKTAGFRHDSIGSGVEAIREIGLENGFSVEVTEDSAIFGDGGLEKFRAVVFLNTTGKLFEAGERKGLKKFVRGGGGFVGIHAAADAEYEWGWYRRLVGALFRSHPEIQEAVVEVEESGHPATAGLPERWKRVDEWYNFRENPRESGVTVLLRLDPESFRGSEMGVEHPIAWYREFEGGRTFYTGFGHRAENFAEPEVRKHLAGAILWAAGREAEESEVGPVFAGDFPDPEILEVEGRYFAYSTSSKRKRIPVLRSENLKDWEEIGAAIRELPEWAAPVWWLTWAPAVVRVDGKFVLFYTTRFREEKLQAISRAVSDSPEGPFVDVSEGPFVFQKELGGSIDPVVFRDRDGLLYLLWKSDANAIGLPSGLFIQRLSADASELEGEAVKLLEIDQEWERPLIENPDVLYENGLYYLIYSANWWESERYAVGYAVSENLFGPYEKQEGGPVLVSEGERERGPGGASFFRDAEGEPWIAYHAWSFPKVGYRAGGERSLHLAKVYFEGKRLRFRRWDGREEEGLKTEAGGREND